MELYGTADQFVELCRIIMAWPQHRGVNFRGTPHISDMTIVEDLKGDGSRMAVQFGEEGWDTSLLVHFGNERVPVKSRSDGRIDFILKTRNPLL